MTLLKTVRSIPDGDRDFLIAEFFFGEDLKQFGGVGHSIHPESDFGGGLPGEGAQTIVGIGDGKSRREAREQNCSPEEESPFPGDGRRFLQESGTECDIRLLFQNGFYQFFDIPGIMLAVAVEGHNDVGALLKGAGDPRLNRSPLAAVYEMAERSHRKTLEHLKGAVGRTVIYGNDVKIVSAEFRQDLLKDRCFVENRDHECDGHSFIIP